MSKRPPGPTKKEIAEFWELGIAEERGEQSFHCDIGEPMCWSCGYYVVHERTEGTADAYNHARFLERCHLVAHVFDGPFTVDNCVLLCAGCHTQMDAALPGTDRAAALLWVKTYKKRFWAEFETAFVAVHGDGFPSLTDDQMQQYLNRLRALDFNPTAALSVAVAAHDALKEVLL